MVLPDIAQSAHAVIERAALFHALRLKKPNADLLYRLFIPRWTEERVRESECQDILDSFFSEIMVNAIDLLFFE